MDIKINDNVRFLNEVGGGRVVRIEGKQAIVEDSDGFERPALLSELVVVAHAARHADSYETKPPAKSKLVETTPPQQPQEQKKEEEKPVPIFETPEGDKLNLMLAFEPLDIKNLANTSFYPVMVNDSNYFLYFTYMTRGGDSDGWTVRHHGIIEPNYQLTLDAFGHSELNEMMHVAIQYVAFKQNKPFRLKTPALITKKLDLTKFFKLHCFHDNEYFDTPVIEIRITKNDRPCEPLEIDGTALQNALRGGNRSSDSRQNIKRSKPNQNHRQDIIIQDLHISELLDDTRGMTKADLLNYQLDKFREVMRANRRNTGQKIVFIHGKGEGVLRKAILEELKRKWPDCSAQDASFQEYGFGATQVTIHQERN